MCTAATVNTFPIVGISKVSRTSESRRNRLGTRIVTRVTIYRERKKWRVSRCVVRRFEIRVHPRAWNPRRCNAAVSRFPSPFFDLIVHFLIHSTTDNNRSNVFFLFFLPFPMFTPVNFANFWRKIYFVIATGIYFVDDAMKTIFNLSVDRNSHR